MPVPSHAAPAKLPDYRRIANALRSEMAEQSWKPGTRLPATGRLATKWETSYCTIQNALQILVREGWIERLRGAGTFVANRRNRFVCAAIYHGYDIAEVGESLFARGLERALRHELQKRGKQFRIFIDSRPEKRQSAVLPELADAILQRQVQCLIAATTNGKDSPALSRLSVPTVFTYHAQSPHRVEFDGASILTNSVNRLAATGVRSIGILHNVSPSPDRDMSNWIARQFRLAAHAAGLSTRNSWIRFPETYCHELQEFGFDQFHKLWRLKERPEGLIVYPDQLAMGATTAILQTGMDLVTQRMKFVFHCNAQIRFICPFPVIWAIADENLIAREMINIIEKQFAGEKVAPVLLPFHFTPVCTSSSLPSLAS